MDDLEPTLRLRIQAIVAKLQKLECTLLGNKDDAWIMELLFKPGFHRCHLIEWMLSKLQYDIGKMSGPQNSAEERMKNLQLTVSNLGICRENCHDIIKGTAEIEDQLDFWYQLIDVIWLKYQISVDNGKEADEGVALSPEKSKGKYICGEYEDASSCINKICESVNLKHLFKQDLDLLSPDVLREVKNMSPHKEASKIPTLEEIQRRAKENSSFNLKDLHKSLSNDDSFSESEDDRISALNQLEVTLSSICSDFKNLAETSFNDVYNDLKPLIYHAKPETFTDFGPPFENLETPLDNLRQLNNSFAKLESSYSKLLTVNSDLESILNYDSFSDENYINILKLVKGET